MESINAKTAREKSIEYMNAKTYERVVVGTQKEYESSIEEIKSAITKGYVSTTVLVRERCCDVEKLISMLESQGFEAKIGRIDKIVRLPIIKQIVSIMSCSGTDIDVVSIDIKW